MVEIHDLALLLSICVAKSFGIFCLFLFFFRLKWPSFSFVEFLQLMIFVPQTSLRFRCCFRNLLLLDAFPTDGKEIFYDKTLSVPDNRWITTGHWWQLLQLLSSLQKPFCFLTLLLNSSTFCCLSTFLFSFSLFFYWYIVIFCRCLSFSKYFSSFTFFLVRNPRVFDTLLCVWFGRKILWKMK